MASITGSAPARRRTDCTLRMSDPPRRRRGHRAFAFGRGIGAAEADAAWGETVADEAMRIADMAAEQDIKICYEFHSNTLSDTNESAMELLEATRMRTFYTLAAGQRVPAGRLPRRASADAAAHPSRPCLSLVAGQQTPAAAGGGHQWLVQIFRRVEAGREAIDTVFEFVPGNGPLILHQEA